MEGLTLGLPVVYTFEDAHGLAGKERAAVVTAVPEPNDGKNHKTKIEDGTANLVVFYDVEDEGTAGETKRYKHVPYDPMGKNGTWRFRDGEWQTHRDGYRFMDEKGKWERHHAIPESDDAISVTDPREAMGEIGGVSDAMLGKHPVNERYGTIPESDLDPTLKTPEHRHPDEADDDAADAITPGDTPAEPKRGDHGAFDHDDAPPAPPTEPAEPTAASIATDERDPGDDHGVPDAGPGEGAPAEPSEQKDDSTTTTEGSTPSKRGKRSGK